MFKALIIDDTKTVHNFVKSLLGGIADINLQSAFNGQEALEVVKADKNFDVIFLDWEMPVLNGPETMAEFKKMLLQTPVIMMTTKNQPEDIEKMLALGVSEYLMKPFTADIILEKIQFVTGRDLKANAA